MQNVHRCYGNITNAWRKNVCSNSKSGKYWTQSWIIGHKAIFSKSKQEISHRLRHGNFGNIMQFKVNFSPYFVAQIIIKYGVHCCNGGVNALYTEFSIISE